MAKSTLRNAKTKIVDAVTKRLFDKGMVFISMPSKTGSGWTKLSYADARKKVAHRFRDASRQVNTGDQGALASPQGITTEFRPFDFKDTVSVVSFNDDIDDEDANNVYPPSVTAFTSSFVGCGVSRHQQQETKQVISRVLPDVDAKRSDVITSASSLHHTIGGPTYALSPAAILSHSNGVGTLAPSSTSSLLLRRNLLFYQAQVLDEDSGNGELIDGHEDMFNHLLNQQVHEFDYDDDLTLSGIESPEELEIISRDSCW
jgi:hypothetical protein